MQRFSLCRVGTLFKAIDTENGFFSPSLSEVTKANLHREIVEIYQCDISCD